MKGDFGACCVCLVGVKEHSLASASCSIICITSLKYYSSDFRLRLTINQILEGILFIKIDTIRLPYDSFSISRALRPLTLASMASRSHLSPVTPWCKVTAVNHNSPSMC